MNDLVLKDGKVLAMTSQEIADLVEKRHDNVKRTIETLIFRGVIASPQIEEKPTAGRPVQVYVFSGEQGKRDSIIVVAQLSPEFTARLVDRWQELERQIATPHFNIPTTLSGALRLAAEQAEQIEQQQALIEQQKPAVEFVGRYVEATGSKGFRDVCKLLNANESRFREFLIDRKIMYRLDGRLVPYSQHLEAGRFELKTGVSDNDHAYVQTRFTSKGIQWVAGLWIAEQAEAVA